jgi:succinylglutamate desuccinylase
MHDLSAVEEQLAEPRELGEEDGFPDRLLEVPARDLWRHLPGPTLFRIAGRERRPLFVSVLLHGNEDTGWEAVQAVLRVHRGRPLHRTMLLFVGNVAAARAGVRTLPTQVDYNRAWPGTLFPAAPESDLMAKVMDRVAKAHPFASVDIHNNTGLNPHYACVNSRDEPFLHLARLFSRTVVYFDRPVGVQSAAMAALCPAVTVECGRAGATAGTAHAAQFIDAALALSHFPDHEVPHGDLDLLQTFAIVKVPPEATVSFDGTDADFRFRGDLDHLNFAELKTGTPIGHLGRGMNERLAVVPGDRSDDVATYFTYDGGEIRLAKAAVPSMLTLDAEAIRLDCLGYLMHRIGRDGRRIAD